MKIVPDTVFQKKLERLSGIFIFLVIAIGILTLAGWQFDLVFLKQPVPGLSAMNPVTALTFAIIGFALFYYKKLRTESRQNAWVFLPAVLIILIGLSRFLPYFSIDFRTDNILFREKFGKDVDGQFAGDMALSTAFGFILTGILLFLKIRRRFYLLHYGALCMITGSLFFILGYIYEVQIFYRVLVYLPMSIQAAICFLLLSLSLLFAYPDEGIMKQFTSRLAGSQMARSLIPSAILAPILIGLLRVWGQKAGHYSFELGTVLLITFFVLSLIGLIWFNMLQLNNRDALKWEAEQNLKFFNEKLESQVKEKTTELTDIFERITDGFIALDKNFRYTYVNKKIGELVHRDPASLIGKQVWEEFPDAIGSSTYHAFQQAMKEQRFISNVDYYPPLDLWQENHVYPSPEGLSVFIRDITAGKKTEEAIRQSEETRRIIMNMALDAIICIDHQGAIQLWNTQAEKIFGWSESEITGKKLTETIIPPSYIQRHLEGMKHYFLTGEAPLLNRLIETEAQDKTGRLFPVELSIINYHQNGDQFFCAFIRDITERKNAEEELRRSEEKYRLLFENNPLPLWMFSLKTLSFIDVNSAAIRHYGYTKEEFLGMTIYDIRPEEDKGKIMDMVEKETDGLRHAGLWRHLKKDGSLINVDIISHDTIYNGEKVRLVLAMDVTDLLKANQELEKSYQSIRQLSEHLQNIREEERTNMAREIHDELGQQLTVLKMDISWLHKKIRGEENEPVRAKLHDLLKMVDNTVKTVRRISSELRPSVLDDLGLIAALEWHSSEFGHRTGITTVFQSDFTDLDLPDKIVTGLYRIFQESLTNVARHANASRVEAELKMENDKLLMSIKDDGRGFTPKEIDNKKTLGILGMWERAHLMGGEYHIQSTPGKGTIVKVSVPVSSKL